MSRHSDGGYAPPESESRLTSADGGVSHKMRNSIRFRDVAVRRLPAGSPSR